MLYSLAGGGTLCGVAALVLLIVSTATDFWMQYRYSGSSANQGLWRFCINHKCHAHTITVGEHGRESDRLGGVDKVLTALIRYLSMQPSTHFNHQSANIAIL